MIFLFDELKICQSSIVRLLDRSIKNKRLFHAYIFEGEDEKSINEAWHYFAAKLLCKHDACGECETCKRIENDSHSNLTVIESTSDMIKKDQITSLIEELSMTSLEEGARIYVIKDANKLNKASSNALLKLIEEPFPNHYIILTTRNANSIIDTIRSRTEIIHFLPINRSSIENNLVIQGVNKDFAYILSNIAASLEDASEMIKKGAVIDVYEFVKRVIRSIIIGKDPYIDYLIKGKNLLNTDKDVQIMFFDMMSLITEEEIKYLSNERINSGYFLDIFQMIDKTKNIDNVMLKDAIKVLDAVNKYEERLNAHVNVDLLFASFFTEI